MAALHDVSLEVGRRRAFAASIDWPGWCRAGRTEEDALSTLVAYAPRYVAAIGPAGEGFTPPVDRSALRVAERVAGNATTDFGAPGLPAPSDARPVDPGELERLLLVLQACWAALDRTAARWSGASLRKGPRGGGRELEAIVRHVVEADAAYLSRLGGSPLRGGSREIDQAAASVRGAILEVLSLRARGEALPARPRRASPWPMRYGIRRSAWHALDHAWEIEDRVVPSSL